MCHAVEFKGRLSRMPVTLDPSDLLLEPGTIGLDRILSIVGNDWGWWRTVTLNLERIMVLASSNEPALVPEGGTYQAVEQLSVLTKAIEAAPKSLRWKARAKVGQRVRWPEMPEGNTPPLSLGAKHVWQQPNCGMPRRWALRDLGRIAKVAR